MPNIIEVFWSIIKQELKDKTINLYAIQITYYLVLAIIPSLIVTVSMFEIFNASISNILINLTDILPIDLITLLSIVSKNISRQQSLGFGFIGFILALWFSSKAIDSAIIALNKAFHTTEERSTVKIRTTGITIMLLLLVIVFIGFILFGIGTAAIRQIIPENIFFQNIALMLGLIVGAMVIFFSINTIYYIAPSKRMKFRHVMIGTVFFGIFMFFITLMFRLYFVVFKYYSQVFGYLGLIIALIIYFHSASYLFLICGEVNNTIDEQ